MTKRKAIPKKVRFEVFKRDKFTCQYCGRTAPDVVLQIDHIVPVCEGGTNEVANLVTACFDCNSGKGGRKLSDDSAIKAKKKQLDMLQERREQLEMMLEWENELREIEGLEVDVAADLIYSLSGYTLEDCGRRKVKNHIHKFGLELVKEAIEIAFNRYFELGTDYYFEKAFAKIGGVCYNLKNGTCFDCTSFVRKDWKTGETICEVVEEKFDTKKCELFIRRDA